MVLGGRSAGWPAGRAVRWLGQRRRDQDQLGEEEQRAAGDLLTRRTVKGHIKGHGESPALGSVKRGRDEDGAASLESEAGGRVEECLDHWIAIPGAAFVQLVEVMESIGATLPVALAANKSSE